MNSTFDSSKLSSFKPSTFTKENKLKILDIVMKGLSEQNWQKSVKVLTDGIPSCQYRGDNGLKCALGHLIPDSVYHRDMEAVPMRDVFYSHIEEIILKMFQPDKTRMDPVERDQWRRFCASMQSLHDDVLINEDGSTNMKDDFEQFYRLVYEGDI